MFKTFNVEYDSVLCCPLCGGNGQERARLEKKYYYFGDLEIGLPEQGVALHECSQCSLLFKSQIPTSADLYRVMSAAAVGVWREKSGVHPGLSMMEPYIEGARDFLDVGASNGDLLVDLASRANRLSALDITEYPKCREVVTGEYIIGTLDEAFEWSGDAYDVVTAFDIFEHFLDTRSSVSHTIDLVKPDGSIIIETGDWLTVSRLQDWYYCNLFEHQIFWTRQTFEYVCDRFNCALRRYEIVNHKGRRELGLPKKLALHAVTTLARVPWIPRLMLSVVGRDITQFAPPNLHDHAFVVVARKE